MSRATTAATLLVCLTLTAGCGGSDPEPVATPPAAAGTSAATEPAKSMSPLDGMSAIEVWEKVTDDASDVKSVHVAAKLLDGKDKVGINLKISVTGKAFGTLTINGDKVTVRRLNKVLYFKADRDFWTKNADARTADLMADKWLKATKGASQDMDEFFQLTDLDYIVGDSLKMTAAEKKTLKLAPGITIAGQETVGLSIKSKDFDQMYVAADDPALPLNIQVAGDDSQYIRYRGWNEAFTVVAPKGAISLDKVS